MYNYNYGNLALYSQMGDHHMWIYGKTGLEFLKFPMGPLLTYALSVSVFQKEAIYIFSRLCYRKDCIVKISNLISFPLYTPNNVSKKKAKMSNRETQGGNGKAISDNLLMYGIHIFSWIDTTGVWLEARGSRQKMLLLYRKSIKHCVSPATEVERFNPYLPLFPNKVIP